MEIVFLKMFKELGNKMFDNLSFTTETNCLGCLLLRAQCQPEALSVRPVTAHQQEQLPSCPSHSL